MHVLPHAIISTYAKERLLDPLRKVERVLGNTEFVLNGLWYS